MTTQTSKLIALAALAGAIVSLTGCRKIPICQPSARAGVCEENVKDGLATIICQPMDRDVTNGQSKVEFEVDAAGNHALYQWYLIRADGNDQPLQDAKEGVRRYVGANTPKLTVTHPTPGDCGRYYCEIVTFDCFGSPVRTNTRRAALGYTTYALIKPGSSGPVQPLPPVGTPGSTPQPNCSSESACSWISFKNNNSGWQFPQPQHKRYFDVALTNTQNHVGFPLDPKKYQIMTLDISSSVQAVCARMETNRWYFTAVTGHTYFFQVYFNCSANPLPSGYPNVVLNWTP